MAKKTHTITIASILGGIGPSLLQCSENQIFQARGIDPEGIGSSGGGITQSAHGAVMATITAKLLSGDGTNGELSSSPMWMSGSSTTNAVFVYGYDGSVYATTVGGAASPEGGLVKPTSGAGNGMVVYNDYAYFATPTDVFRYGRLSQTSPTLASYWVTGLSNSALTNTTYPGAGNINYPNHVMHFHNDGRVYVADYDNATGDAPHGALIHWFKNSTDGTSGTSQFAALVLPPGYLPTAIQSYGTDIAILCSAPGLYTSGSVPRGSENSALFLWDTVSNTYYRNIPINHQIATAMKNKNGELFILAGNIDTEVVLLKYLGGDSFQTLAYIPFGTPPPQSAIEVIGNIIFWGGTSSAYLGSNAVVYSYDSRSGLLRSGLHSPIAAPANSGSGVSVSCLKQIARSPYPWIGFGASGRDYSLSNVSTSGTQDGCLFTQAYSVGRPGRIVRIRIPLTFPLAAGDVISVTVYTNSLNNSTSLTAINTTNFPAATGVIDYNSLSIPVASNFALYISFSSTRLQGIALPITIDIETDER